jgi:hypothetical protein
LDACIDPRAVRIFAGHDATTAFDLEWHTLTDHVLLRQVQGNFDVLVTIDKGFEFQHNLKRLDFGIVIAYVQRNTFAFYEAIEEELLEAVQRVRPGGVIHVYE